MLVWVLEEERSRPEILCTTYTYLFTYGCNLRLSFTV